MEQSKIITSSVVQEVSDNHEFGGDVDMEDGERSDDEDPEFVEEIGFRTRCLMDLVPSLELNIALDGEQRRETIHAPKSSFSVSEPAHVYISLVRDKFKNADDRLVERLGEANWQRHVAIRKIMDAAATMSRPELDLYVERDPVPSVLGDYIFNDAGLGTTVAGKSRYADDISLAASLTSFISTNADGDPKSARTLKCL